jgi:Flp pilus assembly protein TadG
MKAISERRRENQRGMAIFFYATMLIFVIGCVGLAVDVGTIYMIRARLVAAVDAAALAAGRSVNLANSVGAATTAATNTADQFFAANFPTGYFNSVGSPTVTPTFTQEPDVNGNPNGILDISVGASVSAPTYFMNIFNVHSINVTATGTASRRGLVLMLVLDQSSSMGSGAGSPCEVMKGAAENFITLFSPFDQIGLVTFDYTAHMKDAPTTDRTQVNNDIIAISCGNNTNTISALEVAYQEIKATGLPLALNTIVLFTDGSPNGVTANFPAYTSADNRYGPALGTQDGPLPITGASNWDTPIPANPPYVIPVQSPTYACSDYIGSQDGNQEWSNMMCQNMPPVCTDPTATLYGTLVQTGDQNSYGAHTAGLYAPTDSDAVVIPPSCSKYYQSGRNIRQFVAYIPNTDTYGNSLLNGVAAGGTGPTVQGGYLTRENWLFQVNNACTTNPAVTPSCRNEGGEWAANPGIGTGSNLFTAGPYQNYLRPDQPNTVVAASMNGTMAEANKIRNDSTYHPVIHTIYLTGNATDAVDREFLAVVANAPQITALPYDTAFTPYANPAYVTGQETGKYLVTSDRNSLTSLFAQLASEVLRLSH